MKRIFAVIAVFAVIAAGTSEAIDTPPGSKVTVLQVVGGSKPDGGSVPASLSQEGYTVTQLASTTAPVLPLTRTRWTDCAPTVLADGGSTIKIYMATRLADGGQYGALPCEAILATADIRSAGNERFWFDPQDQTFGRPNVLFCDLEKMDAGTMTCTGQTRIKTFTTWGPGNVGGFPNSATGAALATAAAGGSASTLATFVWSTYARLSPIEFTMGYSASVVPVPDLDGGQIRLDMYE